MITPPAPELDDELRRRLGRRFGSAIESWLDELPPVLGELAERWQIDFESLIPRGSMSVVIRCRTAEGRPTVLKVSPERRRAQDEAAALARWRTAHVPAVLAVDERVGALLIEAVEPGTSLAESMEYPRFDSLAALITSLHTGGVPDRSYRPVAERVGHLYKTGRMNYQRRPDLAALIPRELYERGRQRAMRCPMVLRLRSHDRPGGGRGIRHLRRACGAVRRSRERGDLTGSAGVRECGRRGNAQEIAACTSSTTCFSTTGLHCWSAYETGHRSPSSRWAASWKPRVEYR